MERRGTAQSRTGTYKLAVVTPFRLKHLPLDTLREHVIVIHERAVESGDLGLHPLDRARVFGLDQMTGQQREITGVLNVCSDTLLEPDEIGLSEEAFRDLGLPPGAAVGASFAVAPRSVDLVRGKLRGKRLGRGDFDAILTDVAARRYSRVELSMFVLSFALEKFDLAELTDYTLAMIATGEQLNFGESIVADKHCIGGVPGNRTTMILVPILAELGLKVPKTSSRAITSPSGTGDTMAVLADVALSAERLYRVVEEVGACIAWGGALELAPADDILITVERPMEIDTEAQMVASILAKKKTAGATHVLIDIPTGASAKVKTREAAEHVGGLFKAVAERVGLRLEIVTTPVDGPIGYGIGPRLEALDVLSVLRREPGAPADLREKSLTLAGRLLEMTSVVPAARGYETARKTLDSGAALRRFERIVDAQGRRATPPEARWRRNFASAQAGRIAQIDCWQISRVAKRAGAPSNASAGVKLCKNVGDTVMRGEPIFEIHGESDSQLQAALEYSYSVPQLIRYDENSQ
jgi:thymidine phosphorylase